VSERVKAKLDELEIDILVLVGGGGTMNIGMRLAQMGIAVVGIPKAVGNDLGATDLAFGLDSTVTGGLGSDGTRCGLDRADVGHCGWC
jgi:6-phosphofructokinase 1